MNVNDRVITALNPLELPIFTDVCDSKSDEYIVFNYANEFFDDYSDNSAEAQTAVLQIHYFVRGKSPHNIRSKIVKQLCVGGFSVTSVGPILHENDTGYRHCIISAEFTTESEMEEI